jgi:hypothetical protein
MLTVRFTRISNTHHRFEARRSDGSTESAVLETRSVLFHDFIHYAVESEAALGNSFYGLLDQGRTFEELSAKNGMGGELDRDEIGMTEGVVGALHRVMQGRISVEEAYAGMQTHYRAMEVDLPPWLDISFTERCKERIRRLNGHWQATKFGEVMEPLSIRSG